MIGKIRYIAHNIQASGKKAGLVGTQVKRAMEQRSLTCWEPCCGLVRREDAPPEAFAARTRSGFFLLLRVCWQGRPDRPAKQHKQAGATFSLRLTYRSMPLLVG